jgi:hypothetical protein
LWATSLLSIAEYSMSEMLNLDRTPNRIVERASLVAYNLEG